MNFLNNNIFMQNRASRFNKLLPYFEITVLEVSLLCVYKPSVLNIERRLLCYPEGPTIISPGEAIPRDYSWILCCLGRSVFFIFPVRALLTNSYSLPTLSLLKYSRVLCLSFCASIFPLYYPYMQSIE